MEMVLILTNLIKIRKLIQDCIAKWVQPSKSYNSSGYNENISNSDLIFQYSIIDDERVSSQVSKNESCDYDKIQSIK